ncbi:MAG: hypothetical protein HZC02_00395 [Candidatus Levybacteria bacterium]|nr:hypothetical protein [Candidatus Levybacteria bacterium]
MEEKASVITVYDAINGKTFPWRIKWRGRIYTITQIGNHHTLAHGNTLHHIFSVVADSMYLRLNLNTNTLSWKVEEASDGESPA